MKKDRTRQLFADALLELSKKKSVNKITVKELSDYCGKSSQTFYNHFQDKYELVLWVHTSVVDKFMKKLEKNEYSFHELVMENLRFYANHVDFLLNAIKNTHGQDSYSSRISENGFYVIAEYIKKKHNIKELSEHIKIHLRMYSYASTGIYAYWANQGLQIPIETMAEYLESALPDSLKSYLL